MSDFGIGPFPDIGISETFSLRFPAGIDRCHSDTVRQGSEEYETGKASRACAYRTEDSAPIAWYGNQAHAEKSEALYHRLSAFRVSEFRLCIPVAQGEKRMSYG